MNNMDFREKKLYHQIHPLKLATDVGVMPPAVYFLWNHRILPAVMIAFMPPMLVSAVMMKWTPDLEGLKRSALGRYVRAHMTPAIEVARLLTLIPMAYGGWVHDFRFIALGFVILVLVWCNGFILRRWTI